MTATAFPLIKTRLSNERLMSALLLVLLLYNLPRFISGAGKILPLLLLIIIGLVLDAAAHFILYKRPVCAVSGAVTAAILFTVSPAAPFWAECAALTTALIIGKAVWGGTGKNPLNPAMLGLAFMALLAPLKPSAFDPSWYLLPAAVLSLPFLFFRPYAGLGIIIGLLASLMLKQNLTAESVLSTGVLFYGCLVITDPVTTTSKPAAGIVIGLLAGFIPGVTGYPAAMPIGILISNLLSYLADWLNIGRSEKLRKKFGKNRKIRLSSEDPYINLIGEDSGLHADYIPSFEEILKRIATGKVFGMGGAAFPTAEKIKTVMASDAQDKHLVINAAECDPGLVHDKWLLKNRGEEISKGIEILRTCVPFKTVTVAAKEFGGTAFPDCVRQYRVPDFYPARAEKLLVGDVLNTDVRERVPASCGILVLNIQTVAAIYEAVIYSRQADVRMVTVADLNTRIGKAVRVRLGAGVYETAQKVLPRAVHIYTGGGMMNARLANDDAAIDEKTNFMATGPVRPFREALCSQCDFCSVYCPASLPVREIAHAVDEGKSGNAALYHPEKCMECGLCSAVCLAGRDQARRVRYAKNTLANKQPLC
jgi:Na+-translocating ferredoxin:NAD+ oxidoreductase RnfD subunit/ferredoxin